MTTYQAVSTTALAATPQTDAAPQIVHAQPADGEFGGGGDSSTLPIIDNDSGDPYNLSWYINRITEVTQEAPTGEKGSTPRAHSTLLKLRWKVENPDGDDLIYRLWFRQEGETVWRPLGGPEPLSKAEYDKISDRVVAKQ